MSLLPFMCQVCNNWQWMNMIPLLQTKTADTAHTGIFVNVTRPFSHLWAGPGNEARGEPGNEA